jgi:hypothetical protein
VDVSTSVRACEDTFGHRTHSTGNRGLNRFIDKPDRPVTHAKVGPAGVQAADRSPDRELAYPYPVDRDVLIPVVDLSNGPVVPRINSVHGTPTIAPATERHHPARPVLGQNRPPTQPRRQSRTAIQRPVEDQCLDRTEDPA